MKTNIIICMAVVACLFGYWQFTEACSCRERHPQQHFCDADFVILARIKRSRTLNDTRTYKVRVRKEYKMSEKAIVALKSGRLLTASNDAMCGVDLQIGELFVISGRITALRAYVTLCDMYLPWNELTRRQRKGLKLMYSKGCTCRIQQCEKGRRCIATKDACRWKSDCEKKHGICLRSKSNRCMWTKYQPLTKCWKSEALTISRWSG